MSPEKIRAARLNRANGIFFEIKVLNIIRRRRNCLEACRSSGSRGLFDIWSLNYGKITQTLCICKRNGYINPRERREYAEFMRIKPLNIQIEFWWYKSAKKIAHRIMRTPEDFSEGKFSPTIF